MSCELNVYFCSLCVVWQAIKPDLVPKILVCCSCTTPSYQSQNAPLLQNTNIFTVISSISHNLQLPAVFQLCFSIILVITCKNMGCWSFTQGFSSHCLAHLHHSSGVVVFSTRRCPIHQHLHAKALLLIRNRWLQCKRNIRRMKVTPFLNSKQWN